MAQIARRKPADIAGANRETVPGALLIGEVIKHLKEEHLLLFGVILLIFIFSIGSGVFAAIRQDVGLIYLPFVSLLCGLIATVYVISKTGIPIDGRRIADHEATVTEPDSAKQSMPLPEFRDVLSAIRENLSKALHIDNEVFRKAMLADANEFRAITGRWAQHEIDTSGKNYNWVLIELYAKARMSVFSTSMPEYLGTWKEPLGDRLLEAHAQSEAHVTRVFIFDKRADITDDAVTAMQRIATSVAKDKMTLRVWIDDEDPAFRFPALLSRDFTIIDDGTAIGITTRLRRDDLSASWYFNSVDKIPLCRDVAEHLKRGSISFTEFLNDWRKRKV